MRKELTLTETLTANLKAERVASCYPSTWQSTSVTDVASFRYRLSSAVQPDRRHNVRVVFRPVCQQAKEKQCAEQVVLYRKDRGQSLLA